MIIWLFFSIKRCKKEGIRLTSCLNTVMFIAFLRINKKYGKENLNEIIHLNSIGLRMFRPELSKLMLGFCAGLMPFIYRNEFTDCSDDSELVDKFWSLARRNQAEFTDKLINDNQKFDYSPKLPQKVCNEQIFYHIGLSNLGVLDSTCLEATKCKLFEIENKFILSVYDANIKYEFFYTSVCTVAGRICWSPSYNTHFIDRFVVDDFEHFCNHIIEKITTS